MRYLILDIPSNISESDLSIRGSTIPGFGNAELTRSGDCAGYTYKIKWLTGGDKSDISLTSNTLLGQDAAIGVSTLTNGGAFFIPLRDDILRTYHNKSQITVTINDIPTKCANCTFKWASSVTPIVNNIDVSVLSSIKIAGSGFDNNNINNNLVLIGQVPCRIISATGILIVCSAGENSIGTYDFQVNYFKSYI